MKKWILPIIVLSVLTLAIATIGCYPLITWPNRPGPSNPRPRHRSNILVYPHVHVNTLTICEAPKKCYQYIVR